MKTITIGLLGLGTVGKGIVDLLQKQAEKISNIHKFTFNIKKVAVHHLNKHSISELPQGTILTDQIDDVINDPEIQIVVEAMGTIDLARKAIKQAILNGKSVVSANKDLLASYGDELTNLAQTKGVDFFYEASVAGGIPILRVLSSSLATNEITQVSGIVNGTANYILTKMSQENLSYKAALKEAQDKGYAESNPENDIKGIDSAYKLIILSRFAFGQSLKLQDFPINGIDKISSAQLANASKLGYKIKLLAVAREKDKNIYAFVGPMAIPVTNSLSHINGVQNAVTVESTDLGSTTYTGAGAGAGPTASSIISDLLIVGTNIVKGTCGSKFNNFSQKLSISSLTDLPQQYLITIKGSAQNLPSIKNACKQYVDNGKRFTGLTHSLTNHELNKLVEESHNSNLSLYYLPILNSWNKK